MVAHRRAGKTVAAIAELVIAAWACRKVEGRFAFVAPLFNQAKDVAWGYLRRLTADLDPVTSLGDQGLAERAGSGGHEIRTWLIGFAAAGRPLVWTGYEPVPEWVTGMGIGTTFEVTGFA